jgi:hypothetical protein
MGTQSSSGGTQTVQTGPPAYQLPYLQEGLGAARGLFQEGGPQQYQGNTVTPFAPQTEDALSRITQRATNGSPVIGSAQNLVSDTLNGNYLSPDSNPWLKDTFQKAADQSYNTLTSQFARSGRNVNAAAPVQGDMLSNLAAQIYGGAYDAERNRQTQALSFASPLAEADYRDLAALQGVGQTIEGKTGEIISDNVSRWNYDQQRPANALDDYLRRISGNIGSTSTTQLPDVTRNRTTGGLGGALAGYQLGDQFGGNGGMWGALLGGLLGAYGG